jgi:predicted nucleic acid-binding protein
MSNKNFKNKYLKYKNKYLDLQSQIDRSSILDVENYSTALQIIKQDPFKNLLGQLNKELYTQDKDIKNKYHQKYLKYKNKYLYLQSIIGGGPKFVLKDKRYSKTDTQKQQLLIKKRRRIKINKRT